MSEEKIAGVMGGLGPEATLDFFSRVIRLTKAERDQDHIRLIINNNPKTANRNDAIAGRGPSPVPALTESARSLEAAGAEFLVMACNAAHAFEEDIRAATIVPFVSIIDETMASVVRECPPIKRAGVLVAEGARHARLYETALEQHDVQPIMLNNADQQALMTFIYRIKAGDKGVEVRADVRRLANLLIKDGADIVIAGCTEVPLVLAPDDLDVPLIDSTEVLAHATIAYARGIRPLPQ